jgi:hypothetical protein
MFCFRVESDVDQGLRTAGLGDDLAEVLQTRIMSRLREVYRTIVAEEAGLAGAPGHSGLIADHGNDTGLEADAERAYARRRPDGTLTGDAVENGLDLQEKRLEKTSSKLESASVKLADGVSDEAAGKMTAGEKWIAPRNGKRADRADRRRRSARPRAARVTQGRESAASPAADPVRGSAVVPDGSFELTLNASVGGTTALPVSRTLTMDGVEELTARMVAAFRGPYGGKNPPEWATLAVELPGGVAATSVAGVAQAASKVAGELDHAIYVKLHGWASPLRLCP